MCNRFTDEAALSATNGSRISSAAADRGTPVEICEKALYKNEEGEEIIPSPNLMSCIVEGGRFFKNGKSKVTTQKNSLLYACVSIEDLEIPLKSKSGWKVDTRPIRMPSTGGRLLRHRPMFDDWELTFESEVDTEILSVGLFRQIVDAAGKRIGLGDYRPDRKGPYGKFVVTEWKEID